MNIEKKIKEIESFYNLGRKSSTGLAVSLYHICTDMIRDVWQSTKEYDDHLNKIFNDAYEMIIKITKSEESRKAADIALDAAKKAAVTGNVDLAIDWFDIAITDFRDIGLYDWSGLCLKKKADLVITYDLEKSRQIYLFAAGDFLNVFKNNGDKKRYTDKGIENALKNAVECTIKSTDESAIEYALSQLHEFYLLTGNKSKKESIANILFSIENWGLIGSDTPTITAIERTNLEEALEQIQEER